MPINDDDEGFNFDEMEGDPATDEPQPAVETTDADPAAADAPEDALAAAPESETLPEAEVPPPDDDYRRPVRLYRHWVRPQFLQYRYMYEYRTNYYNDVIDYLDKRAKGERCDIPRAQTWAERVLRTNTTPSVLDFYKNQKKEDKHLIQTIAASIRTHNYHTKAYINQKYARVL